MSPLTLYELLIVLVYYRPGVKCGTASVELHGMKATAAVFFRFLNFISLFVRIKHAALQHSDVVLCLPLLSENIFDMFWRFLLCACAQIASILLPV